VQIEAQTVTASMYDWTSAEADGCRAFASARAVLSDSARPVWAPPGAGVFERCTVSQRVDLRFRQENTPRGRWQRARSLIVTGKLPVNSSARRVRAAPGIGSITQSATGGSLAADVTLWVCIWRDRFKRTPSTPRISRSLEPARRGAVLLRFGQHHLARSLRTCSYVLFVGTQPDLIWVSR